MIEAVALSKHYGEVRAVDELTFSISEGEIVGLLGPNGAGKTTTMRMLTTFLAPSSGTASVAGFDICRQPLEVRRQIGYLPETPPIYPELRVAEYLRFVARIKGVRRGRLQERLDDVLGRCNLQSVQRRLCGELSKGYRQRVGLAAALIHEPRVIILDEPTSGLDPAQIIEIRQVIRELGKKHTVVLSTHILPEVAETCNRVIIVAGGKVVVEGTVEELTREKSLEEHFLEAVSA